MTPSKSWRTQNPINTTHIHKNVRLRLHAGCSGRTQPSQCFQLSYTQRGQGHTEYVPQARRKSVERQLASYQKFRKLMQEWIDLEIELCKLKLKLETENSQ